MKKIFIILLSMFLVLSLSSCTSLSLRSIDDKQNVVWKTEDDFLTLYIEGYRTYRSYGEMNIDGETIEVIGDFVWHESKLVLYTVEEAKIIHDNDGVLTDESEFVTFGISAPFAWYGWFSSTKMNVKTYYNYSGYSELDDLEFTMTVSKIPEDELDARNFIEMDWKNDDLGLVFDSDYLSYFTGIHYGTYTLKSEVMDIYFIFLDDNEFEIHENNEDDTLLLSGTYITNKESMTLQVLTDNIFDNQYSEIDMTCKVY